MRNTLYVIVNNQLNSLGLKSAQAAHAVAQWLLDNPEQDWNNNYLILLQSDNLDRDLQKAERKGLGPVSFEEPDLNNEVTAFAVHSNTRIFQNLKLLGTL